MVFIVIQFELKIQAEFSFQIYYTSSIFLKYYYKFKLYVILCLFILINSNEKLQVEIFPSF